MIAVPRSSAAPSPPCAGEKPHTRSTDMASDRSARLMPPLTPRNEAYSRRKAPHIAVRRLKGFREDLFVPLARDHKAPRGHDHPVAVLLADRIDPPETGHGIAGINLVEAGASLDTRAAMSDVAQHPAFDLRQARHIRLRRSRWCRRGRSRRR